MHEPEGLLAVAVIAWHLRPDDEDQLAPVPGRLGHHGRQRPEQGRNRYHRQDQDKAGTSPSAHGQVLLAAAVEGPGHCPDYPAREARCCPRDKAIVTARSGILSAVGASPYRG